MEPDRQELVSLKGGVPRIELREIDVQPEHQRLSERDYFLLSRLSHRDPVVPLPYHYAWKPLRLSHAKDLDEAEDSLLNSHFPPPQGSTRHTAESVWGTGGPRFESGRPDQRKTLLPGFESENPSASARAQLKCSWRIADHDSVGRIVLIAAGLFVGFWVVASVTQGLLISTSVTARKIWLFMWLWERFALGLLIGIVIGFVGALAMGRRRVPLG
jgi:hypothetical protein